MSLIELSDDFWFVENTARKQGFIQADYIEVLKPLLPDGKRCEPVKVSIIIFLKNWEQQVGIGLLKDGYQVRM